MIEELQQFGSLSVAHRAGGAPVELARSKDEVVFLAFDNRIHRLVELHVLRGGGTLDAAMKRSAFERARQASEIRGHAFMRILEVGEDQGLVYYTSNLNDGEFVEDYTQRRGAVAPATALALVYQLLDDLLQLQGFQRLVSRMHLDRVLVTTLEDTFLQLRVFDYGLSQMDAGNEEPSGSRLVVEACRLIFLLLTGQPYADENPDRLPALTQLPMSLRTAVRVALTDPANAPASIEKLRDDVREAFSALSSNIKARNFRKHLVVNSSLLPQSQLQELLLENVPVETILGTRFRVEDADHARRYPFSIPAINTKLSQEVTVHLLPPSRIVDKSRYEAVPLQMWRFNHERHPNILRSLSLWESPDWTFLTEEREPGFALSRLMAERITLNPAEVLVLMRQIRAGLDQAVECGVQQIDLHPSNILLRVGKNGPLLTRELERLMQKRLDAWPTFVVKLRPHMTMRSLYEPLLVDMDITEGELTEEHLQNRDFRHRSFVALAGYLLSGERQSGSVAQFPEAIPEAAVAYVRECIELTRRAGKTPSPGDFLDKFEGLLSAPTVDLATRLRGTSVALAEMESVGSVSDFEDDWKTPEAEDGELEGEMISPIKRGIKTHDFNSLLQPKRSLPWGALTAAAAVVLGIGTWIFMGGKAAPVVSSAVSEGSAVIQKDAPPPVMSVVASKPTPPQVEAVKPEPAPAVTEPVKAPVVLPLVAKYAPARQMAVPNPAVQQSAPHSVKIVVVNPEPKPTAELAVATVIEPTVPKSAVQQSAPHSVKIVVVNPEPKPTAEPAVATVIEPTVPKPAVQQSAPPPSVNAVAVNPEPKPTAEPAVDTVIKPTVQNSAIQQSPPPQMSAVKSRPKPAAVSAASGPQAVVAPMIAPASVEIEPITIRRAILPSKEEIDRMKQGQVENRTGHVPVMSTASQLRTKRKESP